MSPPPRRHASLSWLSLLLVCSLSAGCAGPQPTSASQTDQTTSTANTQDYLYLAIVEIQVRCPDFGAALLTKYNNLSLSWGSTEEYGEAEISYDGWIRMDEGSYGANDIEMLIADLYHESGHAMNHENDGASTNNDPWNRQGLAHTSYDDNYSGNSCPF